MYLCCIKAPTVYQEGSLTAFDWNHGSRRWILARAMRDGMINVLTRREQRLEVEIADEPEAGYLPSQSMSPQLQQPEDASSSSMIEGRYPQLGEAGPSQASFATWP